MGHIQKGKHTEEANSVSSLTIYAKKQQQKNSQHNQMGKMHTVDQDRFIVITVIGSFICLTGYGGLLNVTDTQEALV